jgi:4-hydroxyphenylpyruvate dioxygenase-like putative hemolysin
LFGGVWLTQQTRPERDWLRLDTGSSAASSEQMLAVGGRSRYRVPRLVSRATNAMSVTTDRRSTMAYGVQHVHLKTRDPKQTMQFYVDNFGATLKAEIPGRGFRLDLHGLQLNITTLIASQNHEQHYGIEHIAVDTDNYEGTLARMRQNGVKILEEMPPNNGRRVCFVEAPDGAQMELIEKV